METLGDGPVKKLSIITVTRNNESGLSATLKSVLTLSNTSVVEVIVIDGHSTDNTTDVIEQFSSVVDVFEKDLGNGIYGAMNQGIQQASGEWLIFMNAGDCFSHSQVLEEIFEQLEGDFVFGRAFHKGGRELLHSAGLDLKSAWRGMPFNHQAVFIKTNLMKERLYDESFKISADFDFILWALKNGYKFKRTNVRVAIIEEGGVSELSRFKRVLESYRASRRYFLSLKMHLFYLKKLRWAFISERQFSKLR
jgi:glycosyltransferase involved in cell wall biosynthesis